MGAESLWHWIIVVAVVFLLFGKGKVSELMGDAARGIKAFKKVMADDDEQTKTGRERHAEHESQSPSQ